MCLPSTVNIYYKLGITRDGIRGRTGEKESKLYEERKLFIQLSSTILRGQDP